MLKTGPNLSMQSDAIYKGDVSDNGIVLKIHENSYTIGYSRMLSPDGREPIDIKFGNGAFIDASAKDNVIYTGAPTTQGAAPVFAGIISREPAIASGYPAINDSVRPFQNGMLVKEGYVIYKKAKICVADGSVGKTEEKLFGKVYQNFWMFVAKKDGAVYFGAKKTSGVSGDFAVGRVVSINPDDESVTVYIDPISLADTTSAAAATATLTIPVKTDTTLGVHVEVAMPATCVISYKKSSGELTYKRAGEIELVPSVGGDTYEGVLTIDGLIPGTEYSVEVEAYTAIGYNKPGAQTASTTGA